MFLISFIALFIIYWLLFISSAAKLLQSCLTLRNPIDGSPQAPPSLGFSRQEHWSGLPFPSPMHESEKWKGSRSVVSDSSWPHGPQLTRLLCPWDFPSKSTGVGCHRLLCYISSRSFLNLSCIFSILSPGYLSVISFCFQDFISFSVSLFRILYQVDSLSLPLLFGLVGNSPVPLPAEYSSVSSSWLYCFVWGGLFIFW